jgi:integrase/recombinase XerD
MRPLRHALDDDLALRHALGFTLQNAHPLLSPFVGCLAQHEATGSTTDGAGRWAVQPPHVQPAEWARRLRVVRGFAQDPSAVEPRTAIPPPARLPSRPQWRAPSLSSAAEIAPWLAAARQLPSVTGRRACPDATVCSGLAVTGMRLSAPRALANDDVALVSEQGRRLTPWAVRATCIRLARQSG